MSAMLAHHSLGDHPKSNVLQLMFSILIKDQMTMFVEICDPVGSPNIPSKLKLTTLI